MQRCFKNNEDDDWLFDSHPASAGLGGEDSDEDDDDGDVVGGTPGNHMEVDGNSQSESDSAGHYQDAD